MKTFAILFSAVLCASFTWATSSPAKIGETQGQIEARLGQASGVVNGRQVYEKNGFRIGILYQNGVSVLEFVSKLPVGDPMADSVRDALFAAYGANQTWKKVEGSETWARTDGKVLALVQQSVGEVTFADGGFAETQEQQRAAAKQKQAEQQRLAAAGQVEGASGPLPTPAPTPTPTPSPARAIPLHTPMPPYPSSVRAAHVVGSGLFAVDFDRSGHAASVTIVQSTGSDALDANTVSFAKASWTGQPDSTAKVPVNYALH